MKKIISLALAFLMIVSIASMTVTAEKGGKSYGDVPMAKGLKLDGVKDAAYEKGLKLVVDKPQKAESAAGATATAWILWDTGYIYVFAEVKDPAITVPTADAVYASPASTDSFEIFIEEDNDGLKTRQYRVGVGDYPSHRYRESATSVNYLRGPEEIKNGLASEATKPVYLPVFESKAVQVAGGYNVEMKLPINSSKKAGSQIGLFSQINDWRAASNANFIVFPQSSRNATSWDMALYDYVVLSATDVTPTTTTTAAATTTKAAATTTTGAAKTSDNTGLLIFMFLACTAVSITVIKIKKNNEIQ